MNALSTWCRKGTSAAFVAGARALGVRALALDASIQEGELEALAAAAAVAEMTLVALAAPCPRPPASGRRPPYLASDDREERLAALRATTTTLDRAAELGARVVIVELGSLRVRHDPRELARAFARRQLDDDARARIVAERRSLSPRALDLARLGLDPLLERAAGGGIVLALANRPRWSDIPSAVELEALLADFRGAPLASWYDAAAAHIRQALGFGAGRPAVEIEAAAGAWLTDAAGPRGGLPWGTGEVDRAATGKLPAGALRVIHCEPSATDEELLAGLAG